MVSVTSYAFTAATLVCAAMAAAIPEPQGMAGTINGHQNAIDHYRAELANGHNPNGVAPLAPRPAPTNNAQRVVNAINDRDFQTDKAIAYIGAHTGPVGHAVADVLLSPPVQAVSTGLQYVVGSTIGGAEDLVQGMARGGQRLAANRQIHKRDAFPEPQGMAGTINGHQNAIDHYRAELANGGHNPNGVAPLAPRPAPTNNAQRVVNAINDRDFQTDKAIAYIGAHTGPVGHAVADVLLSPPVQAVSTGLQYVVGSTIGGAEDLVQGMARGGQRFAANRQIHKRDAFPEPQGMAGTINGHQNAIDHYRAELANGHNPNGVAPLAPRPAPTNNAQRVVNAINDRDFQTDKAIAYIGAHTGPVGHAVADVLLSPPVQAVSTGLQYVVGSTIGGAEDLVQGMARGGQRLAANRQH